MDEAGRGPLAGPVVAAAVILDDLQPIAGLADSKVLTAARREALFEALLAQNCQAFLTGTDTGPFAPLGQAAQSLAVSDGTVLPA